MSEPASAQQAPPQPMSFFITSVGKGDGANLGGLAGADAHCQALASAAGRGGVTWHAYLSTLGPNAVNARDRFGSGP
ncbi:MAG: lectin, partial [Vicinamibacterales bacterium]